MRAPVGPPDKIARNLTRAAATLAGRRYATARAATNLLQQVFLVGRTGLEPVTERL